MKTLMHLVRSLFPQWFPPANTPTLNPGCTAPIVFVPPTPVPEPEQHVIKVLKNHYPNVYTRDEDQDVAYIHLTDRTGEVVAKAIIDLDMLRPAIFSRRWRLHGKNRDYCYGSKYRKEDHKRGCNLGRLIAEAKPGQIVRYRNGNRLDCRRENLLVVGTMKG